LAILSIEAGDLQDIKTHKYQNVPSFHHAVRQNT